MRAFLKLGLLVAVLAASALAQSPPPITAQSVTFPLSTNLSPVTSAAVTVVGNPGPQTYYYWIVVNYTVGSTSPAGPFALSNAPNVLSVANYDQIVATYPTDAAFLSLDVLRTLAPIPPNGACNCAVATGVTSGPIQDQSNALNSYTVTPFFPAQFNLTIDNEVVSPGATHLILRQNGAFVADLSTVGAGSVTGTGTAFTLAMWSAASAISNSPLTVSGGIVSSAGPVNVAGSVTGTQFIGSGALLITSGIPGSNFSPVALNSALAIQSDANLYFSNTGGTFGQVPFLAGQAAANQLAVGASAGVFQTDTLPNCTASPCALGFNTSTHNFVSNTITGTLPSGTLGYPLINTDNSTGYGTSPLWVDVSKMSGADLCAKTATAIATYCGAHNSLRLDATAMGNQANTCNSQPFAAQIGLGYQPTCGGIWNLPASRITVNVPIVDPSFRVLGVSAYFAGGALSSEGTELIAGASLVPAFGGTTTATQAIAGGSSSTYTGSVTTSANYTANVQAGEIFVRCSSSLGETGALCGSATDTLQARGLVTSVNSTTINVQTNSSADWPGSLDSSGSAFVTYPCVFTLGDISGAGSAAYEYGLEAAWMAIDTQTNNVAGIPFCAYSASNLSWAHDMTWIPSNAQCGDFQSNRIQQFAGVNNIWCVGGANTTSAAMGPVVRMSGASMGSWTNISIALDGAGSANLMQVDAPGVWGPKIHGVTGGSPTNAVLDLGDARTLPFVSFSTPGNPSNSLVIDVDGNATTGTLTNVVLVGTNTAVTNVNFLNLVKYNGTVTNILTENNSGCVVPSGSVGGSLPLAVLGTSNQMFAPAIGTTDQANCNNSTLVGAATAYFGSNAVTFGAGGFVAVSAATAHNIGIWEGSAAAQALIAPAATIGIPLVSEGIGVDPSFGTAVVGGGGTGLTTLTVHGVMLGNGTSAINLVGPNSTSGLPLISQGASADPIYGTASLLGGGLGITSGTSGGVPCFTASTTALTSSGALTSGAVVLGGGAGACPTVSANLTFATATLTLGVAGTAGGNLTLSGSSSGTLPLTTTTGGTQLIVGGSGAGGLQAAYWSSRGTKFTTDTGCGTIVTSSGGATAGKFTTVGSTSCTVVITFGNSATAPTGWDCHALDLTTVGDVTNPHEISSTTTTVSIATGTIVSGDVIQFSCVGY